VVVMCGCAPKPGQEDAPKRSTLEPTAGAGSRERRLTHSHKHSHTHTHTHVWLVSVKEDGRACVWLKLIHVPERKSEEEDT
jgi:hypothetical protein